MLFTIFTPTYNRAHTLPRLYASICRQTVRDFEWLIVDDGSNDGTEDLVRRWQREDNGFPIRYFWQPNQHKKVAFNRGVREARGKYFVTIDSDDELLPDAIEQFARMWSTIPTNEHSRYCAVVGLCVDSDNNVIGDHFPNAPLDATSVELWFDYCVGGEKISALRVECLREFPFPENIPNLVPEGVVWFRMSRKYRQRCFNIPVRIYHRDTESLTLPADPLEARRHNAQGIVLSYAEMLEHLTWRRFIRSPLRGMFLAVNHGRYTFYLPKGIKPFIPSGWPRRLLLVFAKPAAWLLYRIDHLGLTNKLRDTFHRFFGPF